MGCDSLPARCVTQLPTEILVGIAKFLTLPDLVNFGKVSRRFREVSQEQQLWEAIYVAVWGETKQFSKQLFIERYMQTKAFASMCIRAYNGLQQLRNMSSWRSVKDSDSKTCTVLSEKIAAVKADMKLKMPALSAAYMLFDIQHDFRSEWSPTVMSSQVLCEVTSFCHIGLVRWVDCDYLLLRLLLHDEKTGEIIVIYHSVPPETFGLSDSMGRMNYCANSGFFLRQSPGEESCFLEQYFCVPFPDAFDDEKLDATARVTPATHFWMQDYYLTHRHDLEYRWKDWEIFRSIDWIETVKANFQIGDIEDLWRCG